MIALSAAFTSVLVLIVELDRGGAGGAGDVAVRLSQQPLVDLERRIGAP